MQLVIAGFDVGGLLFGWWLLRGRGQRLLPEALRAGGLVGLLVGAAYGLGKLAWSDFAILRLLCHALFCVFLPLVAWRGWVRRGWSGAALVVFALAGEACYLWALHVEPYRLEVTRHRIESARITNRLRVAVLADLQTDALGSFEERVFATLAAEQPDLLLVPGDLLQLDGKRTRDEVAHERESLARLFAGIEPQPRLGMWLVQGDCDARSDTFPGSGLVRLEDEAVVFEDEGLQLVGLSLGAARRAVPEELLQRARGFDGLTLVFGHAPEYALGTNAPGVPLLCVAGHTHGGQVQFPFFGPPITLARIPAAMAAGGLFELGASWLCVSRGVGMERHVAPRIRFGCRPEVVVLELTPLAGPPAD